MKKGLAITLLLVSVLLISGISGCPSKKIETQDGKSIETAVIISADSENEGIMKEYAYMDIYGCVNKEGIKALELQALLEEDGHKFDEMRIICNNGEKERFYFQIDSFFGKL